MLKLNTLYENIYFTDLFLFSWSGTNYNISIINQISICYMNEPLLVLDETTSVNGIGEKIICYKFLTKKGIIGWVFFDSEYHSSRVNDYFKEVE